eukprot:jgi/Mesvir1/15915/Mv08239-RA.1
MALLGPQSAVAMDWVVEGEVFLTPLISRGPLGAGTIGAAHAGDAPAVGPKPPRGGAHPTTPSGAPARVPSPRPRADSRYADGKHAGDRQGVERQGVERQGSAAAAMACLIPRRPSSDGGRWNDGPRDRGSVPEGSVHERRASEHGHRGPRSEYPRAGESARGSPLPLPLDARERDARETGAAQASAKPKVAKPAAPARKVVTIPDRVTVRALAELLGVKGEKILATLAEYGEEATSMGDQVAPDTAELMAMDLGFRTKRLAPRVTDAKSALGEEDRAKMTPRPPVITIMGHVDHGKTTLLDTLRKSSVAATEAGGITQHMGAFVVPSSSQSLPLTFIDTPGHAAFSSMRARGAAITDIVVLVVAADDGVMPQTREAIAHAQAAQVPILVAINKCDKPDADPQRVREELIREGLALETIGGDIQVVEISAKEGTGMQALEDALRLQAEIMELRADFNRDAEAVIVEAQRVRGVGPVVTAIIRTGTLVPGQYVVVGTTWGRVRRLRDSAGNVVDKATPSMPVEVSGLESLPAAGDSLLVVSSEERARKVSEMRTLQMEESRLDALDTADGSEDASEQRAADGQGTSGKELAAQGATSPAGVATHNIIVIIKADVDGTAKAVSEAVRSMKSPEVNVKVVLTGVGPVTQSDVDMAASCKATIVAFNVRRGDTTVESLAKKESVQIIYHRIIYKLLEELAGFIAGSAPTQEDRHVTGEAQVLQVFKMKGAGLVAGCKVTEGALQKDKLLQVLRNGEKVFEGPLHSLRRHKLDVERVGKDTECGVGLRDWSGYKQGDILQTVAVVTIPGLVAPPFVASRPLRERTTNHHVSPMLGQTARAYGSCTNAVGSWLLGCLEVHWIRVIVREAVVDVGKAVVRVPLCGVPAGSVISDEDLIKRIIVRRRQVLLATVRIYSICAGVNGLDQVDSPIVKGQNTSEANSEESVKVIKCPLNWKGMYFGHVEKSGGGILGSIIARAMFKSDRETHSQQKVKVCVQENSPNGTDAERLDGLEAIPHSCWNAKSVQLAWRRFGRQFPHKCGWLNTHYDFRLFSENIEPKMPKWRQHIALTTVLRDPVNRTVSAYFYARRPHSKGPLRDVEMSLRDFADIEDMVNMAARNYQVKFFAGAKPHCSPHWASKAMITHGPPATEATLAAAQENLSKFCAVGIYEYLADSLRLILARLGIDGAEVDGEDPLAQGPVLHSTVPPDFVLSEEDRQYILAQNELDQRLYEHAVAIFRQQFVATFGREPQRSPPHHRKAHHHHHHHGRGMVKQGMDGALLQERRGGNGTLVHHKVAHAAHQQLELIQEVAPSPGSLEPVPQQQQQLEPLQPPLKPVQEAGH